MMRPPVLRAALALLVAVTVNCNGGDGSCSDFWQGFSRPPDGADDRSACVGASPSLSGQALDAAAQGFCAAAAADNTCVACAKTKCCAAMAACAGDAPCACLIGCNPSAFGTCPACGAAEEDAAYAAATACRESTCAKACEAFH
jgi:hypothetical protein